MVVLGVVIRKCESPITNISQENGHGILKLHVNLWLATGDKQQWTYFSFFLKVFDRNIFRICQSILLLIWCKIVNIL